MFQNICYYAMWKCCYLAISTNLQFQADRKVKDYEKICAEQVSKYYKEKNEAEDKAYFNYASDVLDLAKSRGRDTKPIEKAIEVFFKLIRNTLK